MTTNWTKNVATSTTTVPRLMMVVIGRRRRRRRQAVRTRQQQLVVNSRLAMMEEGREDVERKESKNKTKVIPNQNKPNQNPPQHDDHNENCQLICNKGWRPCSNVICEFKNRLKMWDA